LPFLCETAPVRTYARNQIVPLENSRIYIVQSGLVFIWETHLDGRQVLVNILDGNSAIQIHNFVHASYEMQIKKTSFLQITFLEAIDNQMNILHALRKQTFMSEELAAIHREKYVEHRLYFFLQFLKRHFGKEIKKEHYLIAVPITHEELASAVNSTRPTITKLLTKMIDKNQVVYQQNGKNRWIILKPLFFSAAEPF